MGGGGNSSGENKGWVGGYRCASGGQKGERKVAVRRLGPSGSWDQWTNRLPGGLDQQLSVSRLPFPLLQVLLGFLVPPTLLRHPQPQSTLVSLWRR